MKNKLRIFGCGGPLKDAWLTENQANVRLLGFCYTHSYGDCVAMACSLCHRSRTGGGLLPSCRGPYSDTCGNTDATPNSDPQSNTYAQSYP